MAKPFPEHYTEIDILFLRFLVGKNKIHQHSDDGLLEQSDDDQTEEENADSGWTQRILLGVEKERQIQVLEEKKQQEKHDKLLTSYFQRTLLSTINESLKDTKKVIIEQLKMPDCNIQLLSTLIAKEPRYSVLADLLKTDSFIRNHVMSLVASEDFMASLGREKRIVNDVQIAVGMIGTDALRYLIPALIFKRTLNPVNSRNPGQCLFSKKLWRYQLTLGQTCTYLMQQVEYRRPYEGHLLAAMLNFALSASFHQYSTSFDNVRTKCISEAREKEVQATYDFFYDFKVDPASFQTLLVNKADLKMSVTLATEMFSKSFPHLVNALTEEVECIDFESRSVLGKVVFQAVRFAKFEQLRAARAFKREWLDDHLKSAHIDIATFNALIAQELFRFKPNWQESQIP